MRTIQNAMKISTRCILRHVPGKGWSATQAESVSDDPLKWYPDACAAVVSFSKLFSQAVPNVVPSPEENDVLRQVAQRDCAWSCEWWNTNDPQWVRPFAFPGTKDKPGIIQASHSAPPSPKHGSSRDHQDPPKHR